MIYREMLPALLINFIWSVKLYSKPQIIKETKQIMTKYVVSIMLAASLVLFGTRLFVDQVRVMCNTRVITWIMIIMQIKNSIQYVIILLNNR